LLWANAVELVARMPSKAASLTAFMTAPSGGRDWIGPGCTAQRDARLGAKQNREVGLSQRKHESEEIFNQGHW